MNTEAAPPGGFRKARSALARCRALSFQAESQDSRNYSESRSHLSFALRRNSTSGVLGVNWNAQRERWVARIGNGNERVNLGSFANFEDAVSARREAEKRFGYHAKHGVV